MKIEHYGKINPWFRQNIAHNQNSLSPEMQGRHGCPYHRNLCCLLLFLAASTHLPWRCAANIPLGCHASFTNTWKPSAQTSWGLTLPSSYTKGQEGSCFFTLFPSVAEPYFWTYTHTPSPFSSELSSTHIFPWKEIRNHSLLHRADQTKEL